MDERRRSERMLVETENSSAVLVTERRRIPVLISDESVHGVGVIMVNGDSSRFPIESRAKFESPVRRVDVRVTNVREIDLPPVHICRIGLEWID